MEELVRPMETKVAELPKVQDGYEVPSASSVTPELYKYAAQTKKQEEAGKKAAAVDPVTELRAAFGLDKFTKEEWNETTRRERRELADQFIAHKVETEGPPINRFPGILEDNAQTVRAHLQNQPLTEKIERQKTIVRLTLKGVKNAAALVKELEYEGSPIITRIDSEATSRKRISYASLTSDETVTILKKFDNFAQVSKRMMQLGDYLTMQDVANSPALITALNELAKIPEAQFESFKEQFNHYDCIENPGFLVLKKDASLSFAKLVEGAKKGGFDQDETQLLQQAQRLATLTGGQKMPVDTILTQGEIIRDKLEIAEEVVGKGSSYYTYPTTVGENLSVMAKDGSLHGLAELLRQGMTLGDECLNLVGNRRFEKGMEAEAMPLLDAIKESKELYESTDYEIALLIARDLGISSISLESGPTMARLAKVCRETVGHLNQMEPEDKANFLLEMNNNSFSQMSSPWAHKFAEIESFYGILKSSNVKGIVTEMLLHRDGHFDMEALETFYKAHPASRLQISQDLLITQKPAEKRNLWQAVFSVPDEFKKTIIEDPDNYQNYFDNGFLTPALINKNLDVLRVERMKEILTHDPHLIEHFAVEDKAYWQFWTQADDRIKRELLTLASKSEELFNEKGEVKPQLYYECAKTLESSFYYNLTGTLVREEVTKEFEPEEGRFWEKWVSSERETQVFLIKHRDEFTRYFDEKEVPTLFYLQSLFKEMSNPNTPFYKNPNLVKATISDTFLDSLQGKEKDLWSLARIGSESQLRNFAILIRDEKTYAECMENAAVATKIITKYQGIITDEILTILFKDSISFPFISETLLDPKVMALYRNLPAPMGVGVIQELIKSPGEKQYIIDTLSQDWVGILANNMPNNFTELSKLFIEYLYSFSGMKDLLSRPEISQLLEKHPRLLRLAFGTYFDYFNGVQIKDITNEKFITRLLSRITSSGFLAGDMFNYFNSCGNIINKTTSELISENIQSIYQATKGNEDTLRILLTKTIVPDTTLSRIVDSAGSQSEIHHLICQVFPSVVPTVEKYFSLLEQIPETFLSSEDKRRLKMAVTQSGSVASFLKDRGAMLTSLVDLSPELSSYLATNILKFDSEADDTDFKRGIRQFTARKEGQRERPTKIANFESELKNCI